jgi:hypothetical protein
MKVKLYLFVALFYSLIGFGQTFTVGGINYTVTSATAPLTVKVTTHPTTFTGAANIPATVTNGANTYAVTSIGKEAFRNCTGLTSVTMPNSVTSIGDDAFYNCTGLTSINLSNSLTSIGFQTFMYCTSLTSINLPNSVTSIGNYAFYICTSLTSINLPNSITSIGIFAFSSCRSLKSIILPNSLTSISKSEFQGCRSLTSVTIPNSVTSIGVEAFYLCSGLTSIDFPNSLTSIETRAFDSCSGLTSVTIPKNVSSVQSGAFRNCTNIETLVILGNTNIEPSAFNGCTRLKTINALNYSNYYSIGTFAENSPLEEVYFLEDVPRSFWESFAYLGTFAYLHNNTNCKLYVPKGSKSIYQAADGWKDYKEIIELLQGTHLNFDGVDDHVTLGNVVGNTSYTKEAWINPRNASGSQNILSSDNCPFWLDNGILKAGNMNLASVQSPTAIPINTWTHVAVTYDKPTTTMKLYVNGVLVNTNTNVANYTTTANTNIGNFSESNFFNGSMDEVRIWNDSSTQTEINLSKDCELTGKETTLAAYYKFNQGNYSLNGSLLRDFNTISDSSINGRHGTMVNFVFDNFNSILNIVNPVSLSGFSKTLPVPTTTSSQTFCGNKTIADLAATSNYTINWYTDRNSTTPLAATTALVSGTTYYVSASNATNCESQRKAVAVVINPDTLPTFDQVAPINAGDALAPLPTTSTNGISGTWSPAINNMATTTYTFTRTVPSCNPTVVTMTITVRPTPLYVAIPSTTFEQALIENGYDSEGGAPDGRMLYADVAAVTQLFLQNNISITDLTGIKEFVNLETLICNGTSITSLDVSGMPKLKVLNCSGPGFVGGVIEYGNLTSLNFNDAINLETLSCAYNKITDLKISGATKLNTLSCNDNRLTTLDLTGLTNLTEVYCNYNQLTNLNASGLNKLFNLTCNHNQINTINLTGITNSLVFFYCNNNNLGSLNVSNLNSLVELKCQDNANLSCITVNDLEVANTNTTNALWSKDATTYWSKNCLPVFNASVNTNWSNPENWTPNIVPDAGSAVTIPADKTVFVASNSEIANATVNGNVSLIGGNLTLLGSSSINNGAKINLNNHNLILKNSSVSLARRAKVVSNKKFKTNNTTQPLTGNATSYVKTNGTGKVIFEQLTDAVTLPIGMDYVEVSADTTNVTVTEYFNPVTLKNTGTVDDFSVNLKQGITTTYTGDTFGTTPITEKAVNATWFISEAVAGGSNLEITLQWDPAQELTAFDRGTTRMGHFNGTSWDKLTGILNGSGPYTFTANSITSLSPFSILNDVTLGTNTNFISNAIISVYPNPAKNSVNIDLSGLDKATVEVSDINGRQLFTQKLNATSNIVNIENLTSGVYLFKVASSQGSATSKIVKQ